MLSVTQEAGFSTLVFLSLPFKGARIASPIGEGVTPLYNREFQRTSIKGVTDVSVQECPSCQYIVFIISPHVLSRLLGATACCVQNN